MVSQFDLGAICISFKPSSVVGFVNLEANKSLGSQRQNIHAALS